MKKTIPKLFITVAMIIALISCGEKKASQNKKYFITTNYPVTMIMREIAGNNDEVFCIIPPGATQHTFAPKPSDIRRVENSTAVFYISDNLDGWLMNFDNVKKIKIIDLIPDSLLHYFPGTEHKSKNIDPHFWTDPVLMKTIVPELIELMSKFNPAQKTKYENNARKVIQKLDALDKEIKSALTPYRGRSVLLFHPSFLYFLNRYGLNYAGAVETAPGKQPTLQDIAALKKLIHKYNIKAVYAEPQLPKRSLTVLMQGMNIKLLELDPIGGGKNKDNYFDLMRFNLHNILEGFKN